MLFNKKFDLIVSLGEDCACTSYLRRYHLQDFSYPFDWLTKASFETRIELLTNNFTSFLELSNLRKIDKKGNIVDKNCDYYEDIKSNFYFYHDFPNGQNISVSYPIVKAKYERRINRLYSEIDRASNILLVWWSRESKHSEQNFISAYDNIKKHFTSKNIFLLAIEYGKDKKVLLGNGHILLLNYDNISYKHNKMWNETMGNEDNNNLVFKHIKLRRTFYYHYKQAIYKFVLFFVNLLPTHELRAKYRLKLRQYMFHAKL